MLLALAVFQIAYLTEALTRTSTTSVEGYDCFVYTTAFLRTQMFWDPGSPPVANCSATHYVLELSTVSDTDETLQCFQSLELSMALILANLGTTGASIAALYKIGSVIFDSLVSAKQAAAARKVAAAKTNSKGKAEALFAGAARSEGRALARKLGFDDAYKLGLLEERLGAWSDKLEVRKCDSILSLLFVKMTPQFP